MALPRGESEAGRGRGAVRVARRKLSDSWRDAVAARDPSGAALALFDARRLAGESEAEAAFHALEETGLLWPVEPIGGPAPEGA
ncbi:MAG: hypothetical protein JO048_10630 [Methylobacteriaceae bacterium]|nr:hypothetical protein [Methylobacteriaceae bacterium]